MDAHVPSATAMGFYHSDGFVPAWKQAQKFIGGNGRIGTMLDVVDARLATNINDLPWNTYFTTTSAEYFGYSKTGVRILIVAHGIGPMATLDGILQAYSHEYKDKKRNRRGGRIHPSQFRKLEEGHYGEVSVVEFDPFMKRYEYPFNSYLRASEALTEPLVAARLGPRAVEYVHHHATMARAHHQEQDGRTIDDPYIFKIGDPGNCSYATGGFGDFPLEYRQLDRSNGALAHLLSIDGLANVSHQSEYRVASLANEIDCHEWWNGVRLLGVRNNGRVTSIHSGFDNIHRLIKKNWERLMLPVDEMVQPDQVSLLLKFGDQTFTEYRKQGIALNTGEPEYLVTAVEPIGGPVDLVVETAGYYGFFKYDNRDGAKIMPTGANAYALAGSPECIWTNGNPDHQKCPIQFFRVTIDTSRRLMRHDEIENNYELLMELVNLQ